MICELAQGSGTGWFQGEAGAFTGCSTILNTLAPKGYSVTVASGGTYPASGSFE